MGFVLGRKRGSLKERLYGISGVGDLIPRRIVGSGTPYITADRAMRHSAVWACLRLRADLISTMPLEVYRDIVVQDAKPPVKIEAPKTPILVNPGGERVGIREWLYSSQIELDRSGNSIGIIRQIDGAGYPVRIDLQPSSTVDVLIKAGELDKYRIGNQEYDPEEIWHEKQYTVAGLHVGLSPVAYAAYTLGEYFSVEEFVTSWFSSGAVPRARLKNTAKKLDSHEALTIKESWRASVTMGEPFVHGSDWEYALIAADHASADWLQAKQYSASSIARFFNAPSDLIDAAVSGQSVTYANMTQRNLQFLVMNLGPAIIRREEALSSMLPRPRYVRLDSDSLLRLDPQSRATFFKTNIDARLLAPSEIRALDNRPPFTEAQIAEFEKLGLNKTATKDLTPEAGPDAIADPSTTTPPEPGPPTPTGTDPAPEGKKK